MVELGKRKIPRRLPKDLTAQSFGSLARRSSRSRAPVPLIRSRSPIFEQPSRSLSRSDSRIMFRSVAPQAADPGRTRVDRRPLRDMLDLIVQHHPYRSGTDLRRTRWGSVVVNSTFSWQKPNRTKAKVQFSPQEPGQPPQWHKGLPSQLQT